LRNCNERTSNQPGQAPQINRNGAVNVSSGTTIFTSDNAYTGHTTINAGTLQLGNGGTTGSIVGDVANHAIFAINRSDTFTVTFGVISGTGRPGAVLLDDRRQSRARSQTSCARPCLG
jgi:autotransporter-associated beta strand protein